MILAGDIGGTKTHLALFDGVECVKEEKFPSHEYDSLEKIVLQFSPGRVERACFGVAGPVHEGRCRTTNLPWLIEESRLSAALSIPHVRLINDLEATAWGIRRLKPDEFAVLNKGKVQNGNRAVIAAGTGLGEAGLYWDGKQHYPFPCEGGHVDFAPRDDSEIELWRYLKKKYGHVSYERLLSGPGLEHIFWFMVETGRRREKMDVAELPRQITEKGVSGESKLCREVLDMFCSIYGAAAGNLALKFLALGGIYLGGGIAPRIVTILQEGMFLRAFSSKGRFEQLLNSIPVKVILNDNAALLGAAEYAYQLNASGCHLR